MSRWRRRPRWPRQRPGESDGVALVGGCLSFGEDGTKLWERIQNNKNTKRIKKRLRRPRWLKQRPF